MDFFRSVFADDNNASQAEYDDGDDGLEQEGETEEEDQNHGSDVGRGWGFASGSMGFGSFIQTLASRSESVIQGYRVDLEEFGTGLRRETAALGAAAAAALDIGASVAQERLESVGAAVDDIGDSVWKHTADLISQGKDVLFSDAADDDNLGASESEESSLRELALPRRRYSRFDAQVAAVQSDPSTFLEPVTDSAGFNEWKLTFRLEEEEEVEILRLRKENGVLDGIFEKLVPEVLDYETFWNRYFFKIFRLRQAEEARARMVNRAIVGEGDELSWDVDDVDDGEGEDKNDLNTELNKYIEVKQLVQGTSEKEVTKEEDVKDIKNLILEAHDEREIEISSERGAERHDEVKETSLDVKNIVEVPQDEKLRDAALLEVKSEDAKYVADELFDKSNDGLVQGSKQEADDSNEGIQSSAITNLPSMQDEDDLGWDKIEEMEEHEEKVRRQRLSPSKKAELQKKLISSEDYEDLSWDIEEDDEPLKK